MSTIPSPADLLGDLDSASATLAFATVGPGGHRQRHQRRRHRHPRGVGRLPGARARRGRGALRLGGRKSPRVG